MVKLAISFLLLSGIASLTYQVAWVRLLGQSMGSTSAAISTVLAAFFLGLAIGSYLAERITRNRIDTFTPYMLLELIIGLSGLALLPALLNLDLMLAYLPDAWATHLGFKFLLAMGLLILPTLCMGATFPVMASLLVRRQQDMGLRISQLYSMNTAGAVLGAALSGFVLIPLIGLDGAIYTAFALNMFIVLTVLSFRRKLVLPPMESNAPAVAAVPESADDQPPTPVEVADGEPNRLQRWRALVVLFCTGFVAIASEVGWTKYLAIFTGTTLYGFAAILTVFLIGIAAGSWAIRHRMQDMASPATWMALGLLMLGAALLGTRVILSMVPNIYEAINHLDAPSMVQHGVKYTIVFVLLLFPTFLFGALFPINLRLYCGELEGVRKRIGKAYAVNTIASIAGSIVAGFWIIPVYGTDMLLTVMALVILVLPLMFVASVPKMALRTGLVAGIAGLALSAQALPHLDYKALITSVHYQFDEQASTGTDPEFLYLGEGKSGVISAVTFDQRYAQLQNNGLKESIIDMKDPNQRLLAETLLGIVPVMLQNDAKSGFVVGFGGGVTSEAMTWTDLESIRVVELEPKVVDAVRAIYGGETPPALRDPRVTLNFNDARNTLLVEDTTYDVIVSQPSHPWRAGVANVFTREFFGIVKSRLNEKGVFGQWVNLFNMDVVTLQAIFKAYYDVFPYGFSLADINTGDLILFGSKSPVALNDTAIRQQLQRDRIKQYLAGLGIRQPYQLFWYFGLSRDEMVAASKGAVPNTDLNLLSEVRMAALDGQPVSGSPQDPYAFLEKQFHMDVWPYVTAQDKVAYVYKIGRLFLKFDSTVVVKQVEEQLQSRDPLTSRTLTYNRLYKEGDFPAATELYLAHEKWGDGVRVDQVRNWLDVDEFDAARQAIEKIDDVTTRRALTTRLFYTTQQWEELELWVSQSDHERLWQLMALARNDLLTAGEEMVRISEETGNVPLPVLRTLVRYYSVKGDPSAIDNLARRLVAAVDEIVQRWAVMAAHAMDKKDAQHARILIDHIERLKPDADNLSSLQKRLSLMEKKTLGAEIHAHAENF